jgi:DNA-directed RNA polymerase specialized sigma24 family protein
MPHNMPEAVEQTILLGDEATVVAAARAGDADAFARLPRQYTGCVYRHLCSRVGNEGGAEDLTSRTFLPALEAVPRSSPLEPDDLRGLPARGG